MATKILVNTIPAISAGGPNTLRSGTKIADPDLQATVAANGGILVPTTNAAVVAAAATAAKIRANGGNEALCDSLLLAAYVGGDDSAAATAQAAAVAAQATANAALSAVPVLLSVPFDTAALAAAGAVSSNAFSLGAALPAGARVLRAEVQCTQTLVASGLTTAVATLEKSGASAGQLVASGSIATSGLFAASMGSNPYATRGGEQLTMTVTLGVATFDLLSAGALAAHVFYCVL